MRIITPFITFLLMLSSSKVFAEGERPVSGADVQHAPAPFAASPAHLAEPSAVPVRPLLSHFARHEGLQRYGEGALGLAGAGVLIGAGVAVAPEDKTWSTVFWITGGVVALGSIANLLIPSALETLERNANNLSEEELRARWGELARAKFLERRAGAVVGALFGVTGVVLGGMVLDREWGNFGDDPRRIVGWGLIASGAFGVVESGVRWFVPSPIEVGFDVASSRPGVGVALAPSPTGVSLALTGEF